MREPDRQLRKVPDLTFPFDAEPHRPLLNWGALAWMVAVVVFWVVVIAALLWFVQPVFDG